MRIIECPDRESAEAIEQAWHEMLKPLFKGIGRKFKKDGEIYNRYKGQNHTSSTIIEFSFNDELNGHHLVHPEVWNTWPVSWVEDMIAMIPEGLPIVDKEYPPEEEE